MHHLHNSYLDYAVLYIIYRNHFFHDYYLLNNNLQVWNQILMLLKEYSGTSEVILYDMCTKKYSKATGITINVTDEIITILTSILGEGSVIFKA